MNRIKPKQKQCKCGNTDYLRHGKCTACYKYWLLNTVEGKLKLQKMTIKVHRNIEFKKKQELKERKVKLMSVDEYRSKVVQPTINEIARLIDYEQPCIATNIYPKKPQGGHYFSCGSNRTLALNLHNIFLQSYESNCMKSGDNFKFREGLKRVYGQEYLDFVESLKSIPPIKLSKTDLEEIANKARKIRNELKNNLTIYSASDRIKLRDMVNKKLGIFNICFEAVKNKNKI